ncbi:MAG: nucleotidyltransferase domain-containing protein [Defluviitaleaceae bacterium]|nr:nucleotidyltransferase domain-containing protein [Defluviitaleaceae bacterium]
MKEAFLTAEEIYEVDNLTDATLPDYLSTLPQEKKGLVSHIFTKNRSLRMMEILKDRAEGRATKYKEQLVEIGASVSGDNVYSIEEIKQKLTPIFDDKGVKKAILFGSYAKGEASEDSDIDLAIEVEEWVGGLEFYSIGGHIMETLGKKIDFFDIEDIIEGGRADIEIKSTGKVIYEKIR